MLQLMYSRKDDKRFFGINKQGQRNTITASLEPIVKTLFKAEIEENKKGVEIKYINGRKTYSYTPSKSYKQFLNKHI